MGVKSRAGKTGIFLFDVQIIPKVKVTVSISIAMLTG